MIVEIDFKKVISEIPKDDPKLLYEIIYSATEHFESYILVINELLENLKLNGRKDLINQISERCKTYL